jgi:hypothetical protein
MVFFYITVNALVLTTASSLIIVDKLRLTNKQMMSLLRIRYLLASPSYINFNKKLGIMHPIVLPGVQLLVSNYIHSLGTGTPWVIYYQT